MEDVGLSLWLVHRLVVSVVGAEGLTACGTIEHNLGFRQQAKKKTLAGLLVIVA